MPKQPGSADKSASGIDKSAEMPIEGADKTTTKPIEIVVDIDTPVEDVLKFDSEGARITFDCDRGRFKELDEATLRRLSKFTKTVYFAMKAQNATLEAENPEFAEINKRLKVEQALGSAQDKMLPFFLDNTDPDGMDRVFTQICDPGDCLSIVISKSGSTKETRNGMLEAAAFWRSRGLDFSRYAVAVTGEGSELDKLAVAEGWIARFPMWDWVGGRTSVTSAVGLLPAALQGVDIEALLAGARQCDALTRMRETACNPAALMALMWYYATNGAGDKDMVMLPYKDRLLLFSRYLQQLIMESIGKQLDVNGNIVAQGLTVYGNKGSTDQHAYVQQLREGVHNFFVTFIEVLQDRESESLEVEPGITSGDYLFGFLYGTRRALAEKQRDSMTITVKNLQAGTIGALIALFERTVGLYATLVNINAYHQPGVEPGKKAASAVIELQKNVRQWLCDHPEGAEPDQIAAALGQPEEAETVYAILRRIRNG